MKCKVTHTLCCFVNGRILTFFCFFLIYPWVAFTANIPFVYIGQPYSAGFFSYYLTVLGALSYYEDGLYSGIKVNFGESGWYYEKDYGENWWEYYFEPLSVGTKSDAIKKHFSGLECGLASFFARDSLPRQRAHKLIKKYIKVKSFIKEEVNDFVKENFDTYIIGVHFRGTDKFAIAESEFITYSYMRDRIVQFISRARLKKYKIFVATDEEAFLKFMKECFPDRILSQNAVRSQNGDAVHLYSPTPFQVGKEALIDALLLSKCQYLIRTVSNLSLCSTYFNPNLSGEVVNQNLCILK